MYNNSVSIKTPMSIFDGSASNETLILESTGRASGNASTLRRMSYGSAFFKASTICV